MAECDKAQVFKATFGSVRVNNCKFWRPARANVLFLGCWTECFHVLARGVESYLLVQQANEVAPPYLLIMRPRVQMCRFPQLLCAITIRSHCRPTLASSAVGVCHIGQNPDIVHFYMLVVLVGIQWTADALKETLYFVLMIQHRAIRVTSIRSFCLLPCWPAFR